VKSHLGAAAYVAAVVMTSCAVIGVWQNDLTRQSVKGLRESMVLSISPDNPDRRVRPASAVVLETAYEGGSIASVRVVTTLGVSHQGLSIKYETAADVVRRHHARLLEVQAVEPPKKP
jgi:hypothetical protein